MSEPTEHLLEVILRCPLCFQSIGDEPKTMRMCGHTICHQCYLTSSIRLETMQCPVCRTETYVGTYGRVGSRGPISVNIMIKDVVQFVTEHREEMKPKKCVSCGNVDSDHMCLKCVDKKEKLAEQRARPIYRYQYDECTVLESITKKFELDKKKLEENENLAEEKDNDEDETNANDDGEECKIM